MSHKTPSMASPLSYNRLLWIIGENARLAKQKILNPAVRNDSDSTYKYSITNKKDFRNSFLCKSPFSYYLSIFLPDDYLISFITSLFLIR